MRIHAQSSTTQDATNRRFQVPPRIPPCEALGPHQLARAQRQSGLQLESHGPRGRYIHCQDELGRKLNRQIAGLGAPQDAIDVGRSVARKKPKFAYVERNGVMVEIAL
jgi:hypothetical protein